MSVSVNDKNIGHVTAYAYAKAKGYTGTEEEFAQLMADYGSVAQAAAQSASEAAQSAQDAAGSSTDAQAAKTAAETARTDAQAARDGAQTAEAGAQAAESAAETAQARAESARSGAETARTQAAGSAEAASTSATNASASETAAAASATAAQTAQTGAETAKTAAETAQENAESSAESIAESAEQITTNTQNITQLQADTSQLKDDLSATKLISIASIDDFEDGKCIFYSNGQKSDNGSSKLSPAIELKAGMVIDVYTPSYSSFAVISLYENGSYTPIVRGVNSPSQYNWYRYRATNDCEVVVTVSYIFSDTVVRSYYEVDEAINNSLLCNNYTPVGISSYDAGYFSYNQNRLISTLNTHALLSVNAGEVYKVSGYSQLNVMACVVTDANDNTLDYYPKAETSAETFGSFVFEIPENGTKLYVNRMVKGTTNREYFVSIYKKNGTTAKAHDLKKMAIVGDSLSVPFSGVTLPYWKLLGAHDNFDVECFARSGHGYYHDPDSTYAFWRQAENITSDTYVCLVFGSFNDMEDYNTGHMGDVTDNTYDTICGCINKTLDAILDNNNGIKVGVVSPTPWGKLYPTSGNYYPTKADAEEYVAKLKAICERKGLPFLDLFHNSGLRPWNDSFDDMYYNNSDACHPNNLGHSEFIYPHIKEFVKTIV